VLRRVGDRYEIRVAGTYVPPDAGFFTESALFSGRSCATYSVDWAIADGCVL